MICYLNTLTKKDHDHLIITNNVYPMRSLEVLGEV